MSLNGNEQGGLSKVLGGGRCGHATPHLLAALGYAQLSFGYLEFKLGRERQQD